MTNFLLVLLFYSVVANANKIWDNSKYGGSKEGKPIEEWIETELSYPSNGQHFRIRQLVDYQYYKKGGPILMYTGNEANIELFYNTSGFISQTLAKNLNALVVYAEHRYFGKSLPYQDSDYKYMSSEFAMMDYANLIVDLKQRFNNAPVFTFGGSYGGMLASWMRMKFPNHVQGAVVSGAPILYFKGSREVPEGTFYQHLNFIYAKMGGESCPQKIQSALRQLLSFLESTDFWHKIKDQFPSSCSDPNDPNFIMKLYHELFSPIYNIPSKNYPFESNMMVKLPPYPLIKACEMMDNDKNSSFSGLNQILNMYTNYTGTKKCENPFDEFETNVQMGWRALGCTSLTMPLLDGKGSLFPNIHPQQIVQTEYNYIQKTQYCQEMQHKTPNFDFMKQEFGDVEKLNLYKNIAFVNGEMDPWLPGCVQKQLNEDLPVFLIKDAAHHLDSFLPREDDSDSLKETRIQIQNYLEKWIKGYQENKDAVKAVQRVVEFPYSKEHYEKK